MEYQQLAELGSTGRLTDRACLWRSPSLMGREQVERLQGALTHWVHTVVWAEVESPEEVMKREHPWGGLLVFDRIKFSGRYASYAVANEAFRTIARHHDAAIEGEPYVLYEEYDQFVDSLVQEAARLMAGIERDIQESLPV